MNFGKKTAVLHCLSNLITKLLRPRTTECNFVRSLEQENSMVRYKLNGGAGVLEHD